MTDRETLLMAARILERRLLSKVAKGRDAEALTVAPLIRLLRREALTADHTEKET